MNVTCSNDKHPNGAWHEATPLSLNWIEQIKQYFRRKKYGCGCKVKYRADFRAVKEGK